jgi:hypothetical protein
MAKYLYCTAVNTGKGFITYQDRNDCDIIGHEGQLENGGIWAVSNTKFGEAWIKRVNGIEKTKAEAQAIVDAAVEATQVGWDAVPLEQKQNGDGELHLLRPYKYDLP